MKREPVPVRGGRALIGAAVGTTLVVLMTPRLVALSEAPWARVLPWALLAVLWAYVLVRHRRGTLPGIGSDPTPPAG
ncbi:MAG TPA: hypothetical protein VFN03_08505 [Trueperaceae bacterium]|nr:hypothetical protein [Trueperaceae bacterium]